MTPSVPEKLRFHRLRHACSSLRGLLEIELIAFGAFSLALKERIDATSSEAFAPANSPPEFAWLQLQTLAYNTPAPFVQPFQELLLALAHGIAHQAAMFAKDVTESVADLPALENLARWLQLIHNARGMKVVVRVQRSIRTKAPQPDLLLRKENASDNVANTMACSNSKRSGGLAAITCSLQHSPQNEWVRYSRTARFWLAASIGCRSVGAGCAFRLGKRINRLGIHLRALRVLVGFWERFNRALSDTAWVQIRSSRLFDSSSELGRTL